MGWRVGVHSSKQDWAQALLACPPDGGEWKRWSQSQIERLVQAALRAPSPCPLSQASPRHLAGSLLFPGLCSSVPISLDGSAWCTDLAPARPGGEMGALLPGWVLPGTSCKPRKCGIANSLGTIQGKVRARGPWRSPGWGAGSSQPQTAAREVQGDTAARLASRGEACSCGNPDFIAGGS